MDSDPISKIDASVALNRANKAGGAPSARLKAAKARASEPNRIRYLPHQGARERERAARRAAK